MCLLWQQEIGIVCIFLTSLGQVLRMSIQLLYEHSCIKVPSVMAEACPGLTGRRALVAGAHA